jgi:hypothetical protein
MKFAIGRLVITTNAMSALSQLDWLAGLAKHIKCDWGVICQEDWELNDWSLTNGERLFSAYADSNGDKFWIITERDRSYTTILLPEDY